MRTRPTGPDGPVRGPGRGPARGLFTIAIVTALLAAGGCGDDSTTGTAGPTGTVSAGQVDLTLPSSTGRPVLTITGKVRPPPASPGGGSSAGASGASGGGSGGGGTAGQPVTLDQGAVDSLGRLDLTVDDPFQKKRIGYKGVWLADLLRAVGAADSAGNVQFTALDDYVVNIPMSDVRAGGVFLAVQNLDGTPIPVAEGGPTRVVFRDGTAAGNNSEQWIWSLVTIEVQ